MKFWAFGSKRQKLIERLCTLSYAGPPTMPVARHYIDTYLKGSELQREKKWRQILRSLPPHVPHLHSFAAASRTHVNTCPELTVFLPEPLVDKILAACDHTSLARLYCVSNSWRQKLQDQRIWQKAYSTDVPHRKLRNDDWRQLTLEQIRISHRLKTRQKRALTDVEQIVSWQHMSPLKRQREACILRLIDALREQARVDEASEWIRRLGAWRPDRLFAKIWEVAAYEPGGLLEAFLDIGAPINGKDHRGSTPLMFAAQTGNMSTLKVLLSRGADVNLARNAYRALDFALVCYLGDGPHFDIVEELIAHGAPLDYRDAKTGSTPLIFATRYNKNRLVHSLLARGANADLVNFKNQNALSFCKDMDLRRLLKANMH